TCTVTMNASRSVTATFNAPRFTLTVSKGGTGTGTVTSSDGGISCGATCAAPYDGGTLVTLTASASGGSTFGSWSGCDGVSGLTCTVTMNASRSVTATFNARRYTPTASKGAPGTRTVTAADGGISNPVTWAGASARGDRVTQATPPSSSSTG